MKVTYKQTGVFLLKESLAILVAIFIAALAFTLFFAIYFKPADLGVIYWVILGILVFIATTVGIKLLTLKPIMQIDKKGIHFFKSGLFIKWNRFGKASLIEISKESEETDEMVTILYYQPNVEPLQRIDIKMNLLYDKSALEIIEAINHFRQ